MSPILFAILLALSASQVFGDDADKAQHEEIMEVLTSVNKTVNKLYDIMATQKDRDIELVENKMKETYEQLRTKREAPAENSEALDKIQNAFKGFQEGLQSFVKNVSASDLYKQVQKFGDEIQTRGKELGEKLQETLNNARTDGKKE